jgi:hypothetical protein
MRTIAASGLITLTAMLGVAASTAVASPATAGQTPATASPARAAKAPPPANQLFGVSCVSSKYCVAVGLDENAEHSVKGGGALIQTWNGKTWTPSAPATPKGSSDGQLVGVSCASAKSCVAVGGDFTNSGGAALAESWNGSRWTLSRPPEPEGSVVGELNQVSCTSAAHCIAVGSSDTNTASFALADSWNGGGWTRMSVTVPASGKEDADLTGVSCPSAKSCVADINVNDGGHTGRAGAASWNGKAWTATSGPALGKGKASLFAGVSCLSAANCLAVGQLGPFNSDEGNGLAGFWNGKRVSLATTP